MLDILADAHQFTCEPELLLDGLPGSDGGGGTIRAQEVPGIEAGEVLEGSQELVAADGGRDKFEVLGDGGVVD